MVLDRGESGVELADGDECFSCFSCFSKGWLHWYWYSLVEHSLVESVHYCCSQFNGGPLILLTHFVTYDICRAPAGALQISLVIYNTHWPCGIEFQSRAGLDGRQIAARYAGHMFGADHLMSCA